MKKLIIISVFLSLLSFSVVLAGDKEVLQDAVYTLRGRVLAGDTKNPLVNASVTVVNSNISTVTNEDGYFSLRVPGSARNSRIIIRYLGYENLQIPVVTLIDKVNEHIMLTPSAIELSELQVVSGDGRELIQEALRKIPTNYPTDPNMMVAFYRESIKKGSNYISLVEAVLDVYKASYRSFENDQAKIYIGRKATDISPRDTVLLKFQGGISTAFLLDVAKNPEIVFGEKGDEYEFKIERMININNKPHYIIHFNPREGITDILFRGTAFLDAQSLAFSRMEFNMNVEDRKDAANIFIRKKPARMKADIDKAAYAVDFIEKDGKWYFNYSSTEVVFRVRWTNRFFGLFSTMYTIGSEMAITDRYDENVTKFPRAERIRSTDVIAEKVEHFQDPNFWGDYNVIEPDIEITNAIKRLSNKLLRRER